MVSLVRTFATSSVILFFISSIIILNTLDQVNGQKTDSLSDPSKTKCKEHIEEALNKYWDQESDAAKHVKTSSSDKSIESDKNKIKPKQDKLGAKLCPDDDNDGICNDDDDDYIKLQNVKKLSSTNQAESDRKKDSSKKLSCDDADDNGICDEDEKKKKDDKIIQIKDQQLLKESKIKVIPSKTSSSESLEKKNSKKVNIQKEQELEDNEDDEDENDVDEDDDDEEDDDDKNSKGKPSKSVTKKKGQKDDKKVIKSNINNKKSAKSGKKVIDNDDDEDDDEGDDEQDDDDNDDDDEDDEEDGKKKKVQSKSKSKEDKKKSSSSSKKDVDKKDRKKSDSKSSKKSDDKQIECSPKLSKSSLISDNETELMSGKSHVDQILRLKEIGSKEDKIEQSLITTIFRDLKKIHETSIKPVENLYKYKAISSRLISDAEIFSKPLILLVGPKGSGKTSIVNYLLGLQNTQWQLNTGISSNYPHFTIILHGDTFTKLSTTELAADFAFASLQQFGQYFADHHLQAYRMPLDILQKMTFVDCPGFVYGGGSGLTSQESNKGIDSEVYQWFIDRSDVIYIVIDVNQLHLTVNIQSLIDQLKGREIRIILSKSDTISHSQVVNMIGQLLWSLSPLMIGNQPPKVYALTTSMESYEAFLDEQEQEWLNDLSAQVSGLARVESHTGEVRRHAVRVRNHAKLIDCYLALYYRHKGLFTFGSAARKLASEITENPQQYRVFSGAMSSGISQNVSRYDLPDPEVYKEFFRVNNLVEFKMLADTCSFFKGCPIDRLDKAIAYQLPDLVSKYKKLTKDKQK